MRRPSELVKGLPDFWDSLLLDALEEEKEDRMKSVEAFLRVLRKNKASANQAESPASVPAPEQTPPPSLVSVRSEPLPQPASKPGEPERSPGEEAEFEIYPGVKMKFCWCPATTSEAWKRISGGKDTFTMECPEDEEGRDEYEEHDYEEEWGETQHEVRLTRGFWMGKYPVTQWQWEGVMGGNPSHFNKGVSFPVEQVSWEDCQEYLKKLKTDGGKGTFRLPTEAEWEYACRAGTKGPYSGNLDEMEWHKANSGGITHEVGKMRSNGWGLHDMHGNVWEWCADWYGDYPSGMVVDPAGVGSGSFPVIRGGSWYNYAGYCRSAYGGWFTPDDRISSLGLRLMRTVPPSVDAPSP